MAKYRIVHTEFWNDAKVMEEMTPEDKYFFLYILTNTQVTQVGIYPITKKLIGFEMGYSTESVNALFERFINFHKLITYNEKTRELAIKNWGKFNFIRGGKPVMDCVKKELAEVKDQSLIKYVGEQVANDTIRALYESYYVTQDDTSPLRGQKEKEKEKEKEKQHAAVVDFYQSNIGMLNPYMGESLMQWTNDLNSDLVIEAIKRALKQQKKWNYAEGILRHWANQNISNLEQVFAADSEFQHKREGGPSASNQPSYDGYNFDKEFTPNF